MTKRKWYDFFGFIQKAEEAEMKSKQREAELLQMREKLEMMSKQASTAEQNNTKLVQGELEKAKLEIDGLRKKLEKVAGLKEGQLINNERDPKVGRPKIAHKDKLLAVDLDTAIALEMLCTATGIKWTRLMNDILRDWISEKHPTVYSSI